jgi:hypothetical protein
MRTWRPFVVREGSDLGSRMYKSRELQTIIGCLRFVEFPMPVMYGIEHGDLRRLTLGDAAGYGYSAASLWRIALSATGGGSWNWPWNSSACIRDSRSA